MNNIIIEFFGIKVSLLGLIFGTITLPITYLFFEHLIKKIVIFFGCQKI